MKTLILVISLFLSIDSWAAWDSYSIDDCSFKVGFPGTPVKQDNYDLGTGFSSIQLGFEGKGYYLRAECSPVSFGALSGSEVVTMMSNFGNVNGLQNTSLSSLKTKIGPTIQLRGYKEVGGIPVVTLIRMYQGEKDILILFVIGEAETFPQKETTEFFLNVKGKSYSVVDSQI